MTRQGPQPQPRRPRPSLVRYTLMWMLITVTAVMLVRSIQGRERRTEITYSDVTRELESVR